MAVETHFLRVSTEHLMQTDALSACGADLDRLKGIELTRPLARDHQIAIALGLEPGEVLFGGNAAIHHHQRPCRCLQTFEHRVERARLHRIAGEHPGWSGHTA